MKMENYEKPAMKFVLLRNEEKVAATCWGYHGTNTELYCDISDKGFVSFQIGGNSCTLNLINVKYYGSDTDGDGKITKEDESVAATNEQIAELDRILRQSGGESGNNFKGEGSVVIPDNPSSEWS
ncbi:MAG: hypothetical protein SOU03_11500 [Dorea sp.]|nr:hypothetical protein [Dorea sp.]